MAHQQSTDESLSGKKWFGIPRIQLEQIESQQRLRVIALEEMLQRERQELETIIAVKSRMTANYQSHYSIDQAPAYFRTDLT